MQRRSGIRVRRPGLTSGREPCARVARARAGAATIPGCHGYLPMRCEGEERVAWVAVAWSASRWQPSAALANRSPAWRRADRRQHRFGTVGWRIRTRCWRSTDSTGVDEQQSTTRHARAPEPLPQRLAANRERRGERHSVFRDCGAESYGSPRSRAVGSPSGRQSSPPRGRSGRRAAPSGRATPTCPGRRGRRTCTRRPATAR